MSGLRMTVQVRNTAGLKAKIRARTVAQKRRILETSIREGEATFDLAQALANRDTSYMADHMRLDFTRGGFNWTVGFRREDFVGQTNSNASPPRLITEFYPIFVLEGSRFQAGNDFLRAALELRRSKILGAYRQALRT